jgi:acyl-CoA thioester hydrolase
MTQPPVCYQHRVSYGETDAMQVLYYAEYLHVFERARSHLIRSFGMSYNTVEQRGLFLPVREAKARYKRPIRYDELVNVYTTISEWGRASITFSYELYNEDNSVLHATGMTQHACVTPEGRPTRVPDWLKDLMLNHPTNA